MMRDPDTTQRRIPDGDAAAQGDSMLLQVRARTLQRLYALAIGGAVVAIAAYGLIYMQTRAWQLLVAAGCLGLSIVMALIGSWQARNAKLLPASLWAFMGLIVAFGGAQLVWRNAALNMALGGLVMIVLVGSLVVPERWRIWLGLAAMFAVFIMGSDQLNVWPRYDVSQSAALQFFLWAVTAFLVAAAAWQIIRQYPFYPLRVKLVLGFLTAALLPVAVFGVVFNQVAYQRSSSGAIQTLSVAARQVAGNVDSFIRDTLNALRFEAQLSEIPAYLNLPEGQRPNSLEEVCLTSMLRAFKSRDEFNILSYTLMDSTGRVVIDTNAAKIDQDRSDYDYFRMPMQTGQAYVSPVLFPRGSNYGVIYFSAPVIDRVTARPMGVLAATYVKDILQGYMRPTSEVLGLRSFAVLLDENHLRLADGGAVSAVSKTVVPLDPRRVADLQAVERLPFGTPEELSTDLPAFEKGLANARLQPVFVGEAETRDESEDPDQVVVTALENQPWLVAYAMPQSEFLGSIQGQVRSTLLIGVVVAVLASLGAAWLAQILARPIIQLNQAARQIMAGDLTVQVEARSQDEVGALARTFNAMTAQIRNLIEGLERRVAERTHELERRATQIATGAEVARAASEVLDPDVLFSRMVDLIRERFDLYYAAVFVVDESAQNAVLRAGTGEAGRIMVQGGHKLAVGGSSMVGWVCANQQARIALDVGQEAVRFANPLLPETRSEMALPLRSGERVLGVLDIQSRRASAFDQSDVTALQGMADQIAVALENARLFQQAQSSLKEVERVNRLLTQSAWESFLRSTPIDFSEFHVAGAEPLTPQAVGRPAQPEDGARRLCVPVKVRDQVIGTLVAERDETQSPWTEADRAALEAVLVQVGETMDSVRLFEETQRNAARQRVVAEATARMRATLDLETVLDTGMQEISRALGAAALDVRLGVQETDGPQP